MNRRRTSPIVALLLAVLLGLLGLVAAQLLARPVGGQPADLPALVYADAAQSVWVYTAPYDPVFPAACADPQLLDVVTTSGPARVYSPSCDLDPTSGLRLVVVVQGPRCTVAWNGTPIERRWCVALPAVR